MAKLYSGGIVTSTGFKIEEDTLIDDKSAVQLKSDLSSLRAAIGQVTYVAAEKKLYVKTTTNDWTPLDSLPSWIKNISEQDIQNWNTAFSGSNVDLSPYLTKTEAQNKYALKNHTHPGHALTDEEYEKLLGLFYKVHTVVFGNTPQTGEKGVATDVTFSYTITPNDDTIVSVTMEGATGLTSPTGSKRFTGVKTTTSKTLTVTYKENNKAQKQKTYNSTYTAYVPQWGGKSSNANLLTYENFDTELTKKLQASSSFEITVQPTNEYIYFVTTKENSKVYDQNNFEQSVGTWDDNVSEFYKKTVNINLKDGTSQQLYLFRSRQPKTIPSNFKYKIQ